MKHRLSIISLVIAVMLPVTAMVACNNNPGALVKMSRGSFEKALEEKVNGWMNVPFKMGGTTKDEGIDSSGLVQQVYKEAFGIDIPRVSSQQFEQLKGEVKDDDLKKGDLVFFNTNNGQDVNHVVIYWDNNQAVHAGKSKGVTKISFDWLKKNYTYKGARRLLND